MTSDEVLAVNHEIARNYDQLLYDPLAVEMLDVNRVLGVAALFGEVGRAVDVLDLGCGTGVQLTRAAEQADGRIVGTDLSSHACSIARERLARHGQRADIQCRDFLLIDPDELGEFDLIYNVGVIFITPPEVQRKILSLIGRCLRPGGTAIVSYYAGTVPTIQANLHRLLRAATAGLPYDEALTVARTRLKELNDLVQVTAGVNVLADALEDTSRNNDLMFFHQVLNNTFDALQTTEVERHLAQYGLKFATYLPPAGGAQGQATSLERAISADAADFTRGQYRYAVYAKQSADAAADVTSRQIRWRSTLVAQSGGPGLAGEQVFSMPDGGASITVRHPASIAMFHHLAGTERCWSDLIKHSKQVLTSGGKGFGTFELGLMEVDLGHVWQFGLVQPLFT